MYLFIKTSILNGLSELGIFLTDGWRKCKNKLVKIKIRLVVGSRELGIIKLLNVGKYVELASGAEARLRFFFD